MHPELRIRKRMLLMTIVIIGLFVLVMLRLGQLTILESASLTARGVSQWTKEGVVTARRGSMLDRNDHVLAISTSAYIVCADPRLVKDEERFLDAIAPVLSLNRESALKRLRDKTKGSVILKRQVPRDTVDQLRQLRQTADADDCLNALAFDEDVRRWYPYGDMLSQVLGLTNVDSLGQSGLEQQYESVLKGVEGSYLHEVDARNRVIAQSEGWYIPSQQGSSIKLTIDATIQQICEKAMRECIEVNKAASVICMVSDVRTGELLAAAMLPEFDPNDPPRSDIGVLNEQMRITAISDVYEPGSTFKILTAAAALDSGVTTPKDRFYCSARVTVDGDTIRCWGRAHGAEDLAQGLQNSCNPVFVELALRMGTDTFYRYLTAFGLGQRTGLDLPGESAGILISSRYVKRVDLARIGFGQSVAVTPIQLLMAANAAINGGKLMKPYLVSEIQDADGEAVQSFHPAVVATPIRPETSATMRTLLEDVVELGGGKNARIDGYRIGGKTGTAQVYKNGSISGSLHIGSFYGFAPADDPRISVLVIVKEANVYNDYGSTTAAPFARQILQDTLSYLGVKPAAEGTPDVTVPDITGKTTREAAALLRKAGLEMMQDGAADVVLYQLPPAGTQLVSSGCVMAYTTSQGSVTPDTLVCVPDLSGMSDVDCARLTRQRGLLMDMVGTGLCYGQKPAAGQYVQEGTRVTVMFSGDDHE